MLGIPQEGVWEVDNSLPGRAYLLPRENYRPSKGNLPFGVILLRRDDVQRNQALCSSFVNNMAIVEEIQAEHPEVNIISTYWLLARDIPREQMGDCNALLENYDFPRAQTIRSRYGKAEARGPVFLTLRLNENLPTPPDVFLLDLSGEDASSVGMITMDWFSIVVRRSDDQANVPYAERAPATSQGRGFFARVRSLFAERLPILTCSALTRSTDTVQFQDPYWPAVQGTLQRVVHENSIVSVVAHTVGSLFCPTDNSVTSTVAGGGPSVNTTARHGVEDTSAAGGESGSSTLSFAQVSELFRRAEQAFRARDWSVALEPMRTAAEQGHTDAQVHLGSMYLNGLGVAQDPATALRWFRRAAELEFAEAYEQIGAMYRNGQGVPRNYGEALGWFMRAAANGIPSAAYNIGWMHEHGEGTPVNRSEAVRWYRQAAAAGMEDARTALRRLGEG